MKDKYNTKIRSKMKSKQSSKNEFNDWSALQATCKDQSNEYSGQFSEDKSQKNMVEIKIQCSNPLDDLDFKQQYNYVAQSTLSSPKQEEYTDIQVNGICLFQ